MKYRAGFVSNSSSSSFTCNVCGSTESGMDMGLSDAEMFECENGHCVCNKHAIKELTDKDKIRILKRNNPDLDINNDEFALDDEWNETMEAMPSEICPICQFKKFMNDDLLSYAVKLKIIDLGKVKELIKSKFKTYEEFAKFIK